MRYAGLRPCLRALRILRVRKDWIHSDVLSAGFWSLPALLPCPIGFRLYSAGCQHARCIVWTGSSNCTIPWTTNTGAVCERDCDRSDQDLAKFNFSIMLECSSGDSRLHYGSGRYRVALVLFVWLTSTQRVIDCNKSDVGNVIIAGEMDNFQL